MSATDNAKDALSSTWNAIKGEAVKKIEHIVAGLKPEARGEYEGDPLERAVGSSPDAEEARSALYDKFRQF